MQDALPNPGKVDRRQWEKKAPRGFKDTGVEQVTFHAISDDSNNPPRRNPSNPDSACYSDIRPMYHRYEILCIPHYKEHKISLDDAFLFFDTFTEMGVIPSGINLWEAEGEGVYCKIPRGLGNPQAIYTALTLYRWLDCHPKLVWRFLRIRERDKSIHPFQALVYLCGEYITNYNHNFLTIYTRDSNSVYDNSFVHRSYNPVIGLAAKLYFDPESEYGKRDSEGQESYVNTAMAKIVLALTPVVRKEKAIGWSQKIQMTNVPKYILDNPCDGLSPSLSGLYELPNPSKETVGEFLKEHFTEEKK